MLRMLKNRPGFTLAETLIALVITAVIGAAVTGLFVSQSRFFDRNEKAGNARGVSRGAMNIIMSELRMLEQGGGITSATNRRLTLNVPYAMGVVCGNTGAVTISQLPADQFVLTDAGYSGYAYRNSAGSYAYVASTTPPTAGVASICTSASVSVVTGGSVRTLAPAAAAPIGQPVLLYQTITYEFKNSTAVPGRTGLWRRIHARNLDEELVAPFDTTAKFRFFVNDAPTAQTAVPGALNTVTGVEITLDGLSEAPAVGGTYQSVPLTTSVFFKNRQ